MCLISDEPAENFNHFLKILGYHRTEDFVVYGKWKSNLTLYCYGKEVGLDDWYLEFAKRTIDNCVPVEHKEEKKILVENQPIIANQSVTTAEEKINSNNNESIGCGGYLSIIGIIIMIGIAVLQYFTGCTLHIPGF